MTWRAGGSGRVCRRDAVFPEAVVWTIYYDTPALVSLSEKINSDYLKRKIRVRWYADLTGRATGPAFVEAKMRVGNRRSKVRERLSFPADELAQWDLQDRRWRTFPGAAGGIRHRARAVAAGHADSIPSRSLHRAIEPFADQSRFRYRLRDGQSQVDVDRSTRDLIGVAVLEVKGACEELPVALRSLLRLGLHKRSFSKFLAVYWRMTHRHG